MFIVPVQQKTPFITHNTNTAIDTEASGMMQIKRAQPIGDILGILSRALSQIVNHGNSFVSNLLTVSNDTLRCFCILL